MRTYLWILLGLLLSLRGCVRVRAQDATLVTSAPLTLEQAIQQALAQNRQIKVESYAKGIAKADLLTQWGAYDPAFIFNRSYTRSFDNTGASYVIDPTSGQLIQTSSFAFAMNQSDRYQAGISGSAPWGLTYLVGGTAEYSRNTLSHILYPDGYQTFGGVQVTQNLLRGFGFGAGMQGIRIARANRGISDWAYRQTVIDTVTSVIVAYSNLLLAQDNLRTANRARELAAGLLDENQKRYKVGGISQSDVVQAKARVAFQDEPILQAQRGVYDAENALRALLGADTFSTKGAGLVVAPWTDVPENADPAEDLKNAYDKRPDYQQAKLGIVKNKAGESAALSQLLPEVDFVGSYGYNGISDSFAASRRQVEDKDNRGYSAGIQVSIPLTFAKGRGQYRSARLQRLQAEADLRRLEQDIALSITNAAGQIETTRARIETSRNAYDLGAQALAAEEKKLRAGSSTTFVVLNLQQNLVDLDSRRSQAEADYRRAVALYHHEIGTTLERNNIVLQ